MRILYISHLHPPEGKPLKSVGGMQNVSVQMTRALSRRDDIELKTIILNSSWRMIGIKTAFFLFSLLWRIPQAERRFKPDVILFSSMVTTIVLPLMPFRNENKTPCVTINHGHDVTMSFPLYQWYIKYIFKKLDGVISVSRATREASIKRGLSPDRGVALPNGFDDDEEIAIPDRDDARKVLSRIIKKDLANERILLTVGRQVKRKGHQWFIEEVLEKTTSEFLYLIVGDGPENGSIRHAREQSKMRDRIIITGKLPREMLNTCYSASDLFIMPNIPVEGDMEGFGIVLLEANRAGVPAVASDLEGIRDVIANEVNGFRIPQGNAEAFANKIDLLLSSDLSELSDSTKNYVKNTFNWDAVVEKYLSYLKSVNVRRGEDVSDLNETK